MADVSELVLGAGVVEPCANQPLLARASCGRLLPLVSWWKVNSLMSWQRIEPVEVERDGRSPVDIERVNEDLDGAEISW